jgi:hypothetical protein
MIRAAAFAALLALSSAPAGALEDPVEGRVAAPLPRLFPHWESYLELAPEARSHFVLAYVIGSNRGIPPDEIRMWYEHDGERIELDIAESGLIANPPTAEALEAEPDIWINQSEGGMSMTMQFAYSSPPSTQYAREDLATGLQQANRAVRRAAGVAALFAPNFKTVNFVFDGIAPDAVAVTEDGERRPLTVQEDRAVFRPGDRQNRDVVRLEFGREPVRVLFDS